MSYNILQYINYNWDVWRHIQMKGEIYKDSNWTSTDVALRFWVWYCLVCYSRYPSCFSCLLHFQEIEIAPAKTLRLFYFSFIFVKGMMIRNYPRNSLCSAEEPKITLSCLHFSTPSLKCKRAMFAWHWIRRLISNNGCVTLAWTCRHWSWS